MHTPISYPKFMAIVFLFTVFAFAALAQIQPRPSKSKHVNVPTVKPLQEDVSSLDGIIKAFYEVITGPPGQPRQWSRDRSLYIPGVRFVATGKKDSKPYAVVMDHQEFVDRVNDEMVQEGFSESEIHRVTRTFGNITHVFSTYETRKTRS